MKKKSHALTVALLILFMIISWGLGSYIVIDKVINQDEGITSSDRKLELTDPLATKYEDIISRNKGYFKYFMDGEKEILTKDMDPKILYSWASENLKMTYTLVYCSDLNVSEQNKKGIYCGYGSSYNKTNSQQTFDIGGSDLEREIYELFNVKIHERPDEFDSYSPIGTMIAFGEYKDGYAYFENSNYIFDNSSYRGDEDSYFANFTAAEIKNGNLILKADIDSSYDGESLGITLMYTFKPSETGDYYLESIKVVK